MGWNGWRWLKRHQMLMLSKGLSTRTCRFPSSGKSRAHRGYQPIEALWDHWMWFLASSWQSWNRNLREQSLDSTGTKLQCQSWRKELVVRSGHFTSVIWKGLHGGKVSAVPVERSEFLMWIDKWISLGVEARMRADLKRSAWILQLTTTVKHKQKWISDYQLPIFHPRF